MKQLCEFKVYFVGFMAWRLFPAVAVKYLFNLGGEIWFSSSENFIKYLTRKGFWNSMFDVMLSQASCLKR